MLLILLACKGPATTDDSETSTDDSNGEEGPLVVELETTLGAFSIALHEDTAPLTSANFLAYVDAGFFDGRDGEGATTVHRVAEGFVVQGGGYTEGGVRKETLPAIVNEASGTASNLRYTVAMARTSDPDSATSQWFVNLADNTGLDAGAGTEAGYAVFGDVIEGQDVIDAMGQVATNGETPREAIVIERCERAD